MLYVTEEDLNMSITVDTTDATVTLAFEDDHGDPTAPPANLALPVFTSDAPGVLAVGAATEGTDATTGLANFTAPLTPGTEGTANIGVDAFVDTSGNPITEADGTTPFPVPSPASVTVNPGAAAEAVLTVNG